MRLSRTGFVVIYQWRIKPGMEAAFRLAWEDLTAYDTAHCGALGSRLHTTDHGSVMAYAQWPDRATWERSCLAPGDELESSRRLLEAVEETWPPMFLSTVSDRLVPEQSELGPRRAGTH